MGDVETVGNIEYLSLTILPLPFCIITLFVLGYYIRRRYKLHQEIKRFPTELLFQESYQNHLKNLRIIAFVNNFVIVLLIFEFLDNTTFLLCVLPNWIYTFSNGRHAALEIFQLFLWVGSMSLRMLFVPLLS